MANSYTQDFVRGTTAEQNRSVNTLGASVILVLALVIAAVAWLYPKYDKPSGVDVALEVPYVGPGVQAGTKVLLHGAAVGEVTALDRSTQNSVRVDLTLTPADIKGLTNSFDVDFRPANYFGTTGINLVTQPGGQTLTSGQTLSRVPLGDYTMSTMIEQASLVVDGTLSEQVVRSLDKVVRYTDGLTPLIQTGIIVTDRIAQTQKNLPSELIDRTNDILEQMPEFTRQVSEMLYAVYKNPAYNRRSDGSLGANEGLMAATNSGLDLASGQLFGLAGTLLASHPQELIPLTTAVTEVSDLVPHFVSGGVSPSRLMALINAYNGAVTTKNGKKTLDIRLVLDNFPALAGPLSSLPNATSNGGHR